MSTNVKDTQRISARMETVCPPNWCSVTKTWGDSLNYLVSGKEYAKFCVLFALLDAEDKSGNVSSQGRSCVTFHFNFSLLVVAGYIYTELQEQQTTL
jgi:hypothetical protein